MRRFNWKQLDSYVEWCKSHPTEGKTVKEIAKEYLKFDIEAINSHLVRRYYYMMVRQKIVSLKRGCRADNDVPFISAKRVLRGKDERTVYGNIAPGNQGEFYLYCTNRMITGIHKNHRKLKIKQSMEKSNKKGGNHHGRGKK